VIGECRGSAQGCKELWRGMAGTGGFGRGGCLLRLGPEDQSGGTLVAQQAMLTRHICGHRPHMVRRSRGGGDVSNDGLPCLHSSPCCITHAAAVG
jgi:hypothetical protein